MFDALTDRLTGVFDRLSGKGVLSEKDVTEVMREIRVALLEADVALPVVRDFIAKATEAATGEAVNEPPVRTRCSQIRLPVFASYAVKMPLLLTV